MTGLRDPGPPPATLTVTVPFAIKLRGGRKLVVAAPGAEPWRPARHRIDNAMIKAIARAHRWKALLESGAYATLGDLAAAEKINPSYVSRIIRLTLLAPDIVKAILDGRQPPALQLDDLLSLFPVEWEGQRAMFEDPANCRSARSGRADRSGSANRRNPGGRSSRLRSRAGHHGGSSFRRHCRQGECELAAWALQHRP